MTVGLSPKNKSKNSPFTKHNLLKGTRLSDEPDTFSLDKIEKQIVISKLYHLNYDPKLLTDRNRASIVNMLGREQTLKEIAEASISDAEHIHKKSHSKTETSKMSLITDRSTANTKSKDLDRPKFGAAMTIQERKHEVINWKLNKIKNLPAFVKSELAKNPDGDNKTARRKKE